MVVDAESFHEPTSGGVPTVRDAERRRCNKCRSPGTYAAVSLRGDTASRVEGAEREPMQTV